MPDTKMPDNNLVILANRVLRISIDRRTGKTRRLPFFRAWRNGWRLRMPGEGWAS